MMTGRNGVPWPSVSVVIVTQARDAFLRRAIRSVVSQRYPGRLECIVVFDQSPAFDLSDVAPADGGDRTLRVIENRGTPGPAGARNGGRIAPSATCCRSAEPAMNGCRARWHIRSRRWRRPAPMWPPRGSSVPHAAACSSAGRRATASRPRRCSAAAQPRCIPRRSRCVARPSTRRSARSTRRSRGATGMSTTGCCGRSSSPISWRCGKPSCAWTVATIRSSALVGGRSPR